MITVDSITALVEEKIDGTTMFVVDVSVSSSNKIMVEIDGIPSVSIDDCVAVSRHIEGSLDRDVEDFELQVSSAGLDKPLRHRKQYEKNLGRTVRVLTNDGEELVGEILSVGDELQLNLPPSKKKKLPEREHSLNWDAIKETKIKISFK